MPDHADLVAALKAHLVAAGVPLAGPCGAFEITRRLPPLLASEQWGFVKAPAGGEHCQGVRTDKLVSALGYFVDCLIDAGNANGPVWQLRAATTDESNAYVNPAALQIVDTPPAEPAPEPPVEPSNDLRAFAAELFKEFDAGRAELAALRASVDALRASVDAIAKSGIRVHL